MIDLLMSLFSSDDKDDFAGMSRWEKLGLALLVVLVAIGGTVLWWQFAVVGL